MKLNFKFSNLCGVVYGQGNLLYTADGKYLISPVGYRVSVFDLVNGGSFTFEFETLEPIRCIALSPDGSLLVTVDEGGHAILCNFLRRVVLHHFSLGRSVAAISFSPDGKLMAVAAGRIVELWRTPASDRREFAPFALVKKMGGHREDIVALEWSADSRFIVTASDDMTARVYLVALECDENGTCQYVPITLAAHKHRLIAAFFADNARKIYTIGRDGAVFVWNFDSQRGCLEDPTAERLHLALTPNETRASNDDSDEIPDASADQVGLRPRVSSVFFNSVAKLMLVGYATGVFGLFRMEPFELLQSLSISTHPITAASMNRTCEWLAVGSSTLGQLLVWEWQSESFILQQQGHSNVTTKTTTNCMAYSSDGQILATGGQDGKVKLWNAESAVCISTFAEHTSSVSAIEFTKQGKVLLSASNDGTIRAYDLIRFKCFRIMTTPTPVQFASLAVDFGGDVVVAGTLDTFEIYLWSIQTGQLLDILAGHTGPVASLTFDPPGQKLASGSWDKSVRLWDVFARKVDVQAFAHTSDVLAIVFKPDAREIAAATLNGEITVWDVENAAIVTTIDCRRDISEKRMSHAAFHGIAYSTDGTCLLAAGSFPFAAIYDVESKVLVKKFPLSRKRRSETDDEATLHIVGEEERKATVEARSIKFSPNGRSWACITSEGLLTYSLDDSILFDPFDLDLDLTPASVLETLHKDRQPLRALVQAFRLNILSVTQQVFLAVPVDSIPLLIYSLPNKYLSRLLEFLPSALETCPRIELLMTWLAITLEIHGARIRADRARLLPVFRQLIKGLIQKYDDLAEIVDGNRFFVKMVLERVYSKI